MIGQSALLGCGLRVRHGMHARAARALVRADRHARTRAALLLHAPGAAAAAAPPPPSPPTHLRICDAAVVQDLQQHVEHVCVRFLDLVEQDDGVRAAAAHQKAEKAEGSKTSGSGCMCRRCWSAAAEDARCGLSLFPPATIPRAMGCRRTRAATAAARPLTALPPSAARPPRSQHSQGERQSSVTRCAARGRGGDRVGRGVAAEADAWCSIISGGGSGTGGANTRGCKPRQQMSKAAALAAAGAAGEGQQN